MIDESAVVKEEETTEGSNVTEISDSQLEQGVIAEPQAPALKRLKKKALRRYLREEELKPYQAELIKMQQHLEQTGKRMIILFSYALMIALRLSVSLFLNSSRRCSKFSFVVSICC